MKNGNYTVKSVNFAELEFINDCYFRVVKKRKVYKWWRLRTNMQNVDTKKLERIASMHNAAVLNGILTLHIPYDQNGVIECPKTGDMLDDFSTIINEPVKYAGRTTAKVRGKERRIERENSVLKDNDTQELAQLEYRVLNELKSRGHPVPQQLSCNDTTIEMEKISGYTLKHLTQRLINVFSGSMGSIFGDPTQKLGELFFPSYETGLRIDKDISNILTDTEKEYLKNKKTENLTKKFNTSKENIIENIDAYRIMESLEFYDEKFIEVFRPLQEHINSTRKKFSRWISSASTDNVLVSNPEDVLHKPVTKTDPYAKDIHVTDFNHIEYSPIQLNIFYLFDAYLPQKAIAHKNYFSGTHGVLLNPFGFQERIGTILPYCAQAWNETNPDDKIASYRDFVAGYMEMRVPTAIRQIGYALNEAKDAQSHERYYDATQEAKHFKRVAMESLEAMSCIPEVFGPEMNMIAKYLGKKISDLAKKKIDKDIYRATIHWSKQS